MKKQIRKTGFIFIAEAARTVVQWRDKQGTLFHREHPTSVPELTQTCSVIRGYKERGDAKVTGSSPLPSIQQTRTAYGDPYFFVGLLARVQDSSLEISAKKSPKNRSFDHCVLMFGSGLSHGSQHVGSNLPLVLAGGKSSGLKPANSWIIPTSLPMPTVC